MSEIYNSDICGQHWRFSKGSLDVLNDTVTKVITQSLVNISDVTKVVLPGVKDGTKLVYRKHMQKLWRKYYYIRNCFTLMMIYLAGLVICKEN